MADILKPFTRVKRFIPLAVVVLALGLFVAFDGPSYVNLETLKANREGLLDLVQGYFLTVFIGFILVYAILTAMSFPGASFLSVFGGFLFGTWVGGGAIIIGASCGATGIFLAVRYAIGDMLSKRAGPYMQKFEAGLKENELSYLFILRLVPVFPFFIVNIVPAFFNVKVRNYVLATFFGIMPGCFVYASVGAGLGAVLDQGGEVQLGGLMTQPKILLPILGLIILSLIPAIYKNLARKPV